MFQSFAAQVAVAETSNFWVPTTIALAAVLVAFCAAFVYLKRKRVIQDTPTALIRSAPQGYIELNGWVELMDGPPICAPLSGRTCCWYRYKVERHERQGKNSAWRTLDSGTSDDLFYLVDETGKCAVDPQGATVETDHQDTWYGNSQDTSGHARRSGWGIGKKYRFTESRLELSDHLYVIGNFTTHGGAATPFDPHAAVGDLLRNWKNNQNEMLARFDTNGDGQIDMQEWQNARTAAEKIVLEQRHEHASAPPVDVIGETSNRSLPFIVSNRDESKLVARYLFLSMGSFAFAVGGGLCLFWLISVRLSS